MSSYILGIDIGSVAVSTALINDKKEIVKTGYVFHKGEIKNTLEKELEKYELNEVYVAKTTSVPKLVSGHKSYDNQVAFISGAKTIHNRFDSILFVGGEKFGHLVFDDKGNYKSFKTNTSCAAGTGSFLDQQAGRLNLSGIEELSEIAFKNESGFPLIASRCAVFAKTDLIHAQQEGYTFDQISDGLCYGLAKNITDTLFTGEKPHGKIIFCGGVSKNKAVKKHIEDIADISLTADEYAHVYGALGAAFLLFDEIAENKSDFDKSFNGRDILQEVEHKKELYYEPLNLKLSEYPDFSSLESYLFQPSKKGAPAVETDLYEIFYKNSKQEFFLGIDIGSTSTKAVLTDENKKVWAGFYTRTAGNPLLAVCTIFEAVDDISSKYTCEVGIKGCATTGSGRKFIGKIVGSDMAVDEITAHARAAAEINPMVDTIIEIGGQDAKFTTLKNGIVTFSTMNNVCAAGTGSFIEEQAKKLGVDVRDYSNRTMDIMAPMSSDRCTVFMERDINHYLAEGYRVEEVLASALHSVRENYLVKVATESLIGDFIYFQGATAKNEALVAAFEQRLKKPIHVSKYCHLTGALGSALILMEEFKENTAFRGLELYKQDIPITSEVCGLCNNNCKISVADINGEKVAYGFLCGRDYETKKYVGKSKTGFDLLKERKKIYAANSDKNAVAAKNSPVVGIPFSLHLVEDMHMWQEFFSILGVKTITSEKYKNAVKKGKKLSETEFCAPASAMFGHVDYLNDKSDFIFLPFYLEDKSKTGRMQYCYYTQYIPSLASRVCKEKVLSPLVNYLYTNFHTKLELYKMFRSMGLKKSFFDISSAFEAAVNYKNKSLDDLNELYEKEVKQASDINVVLLGRPYTVLSETMNNRIPHIFSSLGIKTFYQDMIGSDEKSDIMPLMEDVHWKYASMILGAAEKVAKTDNLYPVFVTSFKCSPDSFALKFFKELMEKHEKPYLILELDEHDSSVGYETRIEAAVRAFRNDFGSMNKKHEIDYSSLFFESEKNIKDKNLIFPNWDNITSKLLAAALKKEGINTYLIEESEATIAKSMKFNTGQCVPANSIAQGFVETIEKNNLDPKDCVLWMSKTNFCNIKLYPNYIKALLPAYGNGMEKAGIYHGELTFIDISLRAAKNAYFAHMFGGMLRKLGCKIRPYEVNKGETNSVINKSMEIFEDSFLGKISKEAAVKQVVQAFKNIEIKKETRPKVAIFGDFYVRDNHVINQNLVEFIEENGGEVITTPYTELGKIIAPMYFKKWFNEKLYLNLVSVKVLVANMKLVEKKYMKFFNEVLNEPEYAYNEDPEKILGEFGVLKENVGESMENLLKIYYLSKHHDDLALFVQANPAFCCPSLVTESMKRDIEKITSVPIATITYDGTGGMKNRSIIPYLKFCGSGDIQDNRRVLVS